MPRREPTESVTSAAQVTKLARGLSRQGADLYAHLASRMAELGNAPARDAFGRIGAALAGGHMTQHAEESVDLPTVFQDEDLGATRLVTPYAAYSLAVRNQERAFAFWTYVSGGSPDADVREEVENRAREEIARVKSLRSARRRAFHAKRPPAVAVEILRNASTEQLAQQAGASEGRLAALHERIAAALAETGDPRATTIDELAAEERANAERMGARPATRQRSEPLPQGPDALVALAAEQLEAAVELYLAAAEVSRREEVVAVAQNLAERGIRRLSRLP